MNPPNERRPLRLKVDAIDVDQKPWCVRTLDGRIRGPVGLAGLRSLLEVGLLDETSTISPIASEDWRKITENPVWLELRSGAKEFTFRAKEGVDSTPPLPPPVPAGSAAPEPPAPTAPESAVLPGGITARRAEQIEQARRRETQRQARMIRYWYAAKATRAVRELLVFLGFLTLADLASSFIDSSLSVVRWGVLLCLAVVALGYYVFRSLVD